MIKKLYRCPKCGEVVTDKELDERMDCGGLPYCYCEFSAYDENGEIWFPRRYVEYEIFVREEQS